MKKLYLLIALLLLLTSCKNEDKFKDVVYFTGTETSPVTRFTIDGPAELGLSVTASTKVPDDITVDLAYESGLIDVYNQKHGKNYKAIPPKSFTLSASQTLIKAGTNVSMPVKLSITSLDGFEEGVTYLLPFSLVNSSSLPVLEASRTLYVVINRTIITQAASLRDNYFTVDFSKSSELASVPAVTMEARVSVNSFQSRSPFISTVMGIEENFLMRFGDVGVDPNKLQLAGGGYQLAASTGLSTKTWYHLALVYDGAKVYMYIDGKLEASRDAPRGPINLADSYSGGFHVGYSAGSRYLDGTISECRVWTRALTQAELQNNVCYVDPTSKGLLAYWRFNEGSGKDAVDLTGHGHTAVGARPLAWVLGVRCP